MEFVDLIKTPRVDNVVLHRPFHSPVEGTLCVTGHHLILSSRRDRTEELWLLHRNVDSIERKFVGPVGYLKLRCKDFRVLKLDVPGMEDCLNVANSIEILSTLGNDEMSLTYPFFFRPLFDMLEDGWSAYLVCNEFARIQSLTDDWRISNVNRTFQVCSSYPGSVIVPKSISDECLVESSKFRYLNRFPVLTYYHPDNGCVIMRCSQPLAGTNNRRCKEDERLVNSMMGVGKRGYILDTRSNGVAMTAKARGGGVEPEAHYPQWKRLHSPIDRHTTLLESLSKFVEACLDDSSMDKWLSRTDSSSWFSNIKNLLETACVVAQCVDRDGASVLVHGSEGTDSTLQVTSLAQIILDADSRSVRGFEALVEREWLQAGHPFASRCAKSVYSSNRSRAEAPSFVLFLDCVWQIYQQFPCSFQFNEQFLVTLFDHAYASQFGTFMCDNVCERVTAKLPQKTVSLWSYINRPEILQTYMNSMYEPNQSVIWPSVAPQSIQLWAGLYLRWEQDDTAIDSAWSEINRVCSRHKELKSFSVKLRRQLFQLHKEYSDVKNIAEPI